MNVAFNTDTAALRTRADLNAARGKHDLEEWILGHIPSPRGLRILDLGCGMGKQLFRLASLVTRAGSLLGIDLSEAAVRAVNERARLDGFANVEARQMSLDACVQSLSGDRFDLILSSYAIYYATDMPRLLQDLRTLLRANGSVFVCGPGRGTNREMIEMVNACLGSGADKGTSIEDFLSSASIQETARVYSRSMVSRLENVVRFDTPESLLAWWTRHNSFVPSVLAEVARRAHDHFRTHSSFALTKNVLGVRFDNISGAAQSRAV